jgi:hypothetical protein
VGNFESGTTVACSHNKVLLSEKLFHYTSNLPWRNTLEVSKKVNDLTHLNETQVLPATRTDNHIVGFTMVSEFLAYSITVHLGSCIFRTIVNAHSGPS